MPNLDVSILLSDLLGFRVVVPCADGARWVCVLTSAFDPLDVSILLFGLLDSSAVVPCAAGE